MKWVVTIVVGCALLAGCASSSASRAERDRARFARARAAEKASQLRTWERDPRRALRVLLQEPQTQVRVWANDFLIERGPRAAPLVPDLLAYLRPLVGERQASAEAERTCMALRVVQSIGPDARAAIPVLDALMRRNRGNYVAETAAHALSRLGPAGVGALTDALADPERRVRRVALECFSEVWDPKLLLPVRADLAAVAAVDRSADLRVLARRTLRYRLGPRAAPVWRTLAATLDPARPDESLESLRALEALREGLTPAERAELSGILRSFAQDAALPPALARSTRDVLVELSPSSGSSSR